MVFIHFFENSQMVLTQLLKTSPSIDQNIKVKGRKGKVIKIDPIDDRVIHVHVQFEPVLKKSLPAADPKKKRR